MSSHTLTTAIKENPIITAATVLGSIATIVTILIAVRSSVVLAGDFKVYQTEQAQAVQQLGVKSELQNNTIRKQMLEDKVFDITLIPTSKRTDIDRARLDKYERDLDNINREIKDIKAKIK